MSRAYRIRVQEQLRRVVRAQDKVSTQLSLLDVLPAASMAEILGAELEKQGFERQGNHHERRQNGVLVSVDTKTGEISLGLQAEEQVNLHLTRDALGDEDWGEQEKKRAAQDARNQLNQELHQQADQRAANLQRQVTDRLEGALGAIQTELNQVTNRATAAALKQKAAQMGQVKEITEDPDSGALTIVVEV